VLLGGDRNIGGSPGIRGGPLSDGIHESFETAFDRLYRILIPQGCINVSSKVGWHLGTGFADDQHVVLTFQPDEVTRLEDHVIAWNRQFCLAVVYKVVILGEKEDAANRASRCLLDLIEYRAAGRVRAPSRSPISAVGCHFLNPFS
jgi:hypothetical protein